MAGDAAEYDVKACAAVDLTRADLAACIAIIKSGGAVDVGSAGRELPRSAALAVARRDGAVVGVGVIKRVRSYYASGVAKRSGENFPANAPEVGYIAVDPEHQGRGLSGRLVAVLMSGQPGFAFATTSNDRMKKTLAKAGFVRKGKEWKGKTGAVSLWTRG